MTQAYKAFFGGLNAVIGGTCPKIIADVAAAAAKKIAEIDKTVRDDWVSYPVILRLAGRKVDESFTVKANVCYGEEIAVKTISSVGFFYK